MIKRRQLLLFLAAVLVGFVVTGVILVETGRRNVSTHALPLPILPAPTRKVVEGLLSPGEELQRLVQGETLNASLTNRQAGYAATVHLASNPNQGWQITNTEFYANQAPSRDLSEVRVSGHLSREDIRSIMAATRTPFDKSDETNLLRSLRFQWGVPIAEMQEHGTVRTITQRPDGSVEVDLTLRRVRGPFLWLRLVRTNETWVLERVLRAGYS